MHEYRLRPRALRDLDDIWDCTVGTWGELQAERYLRELGDAMAEFAREPQLGRPRDDQETKR